MSIENHMALYDPYEWMTRCKRTDDDWDSYTELDNEYDFRCDACNEGAYYSEESPIDGICKSCYTKFINRIENELQARSTIAEREVWRAFKELIEIG